MSLTKPKRPRGKQPIRYTDAATSKPYPVFVERSFWKKSTQVIRVDSFQNKVIGIAQLLPTQRPVSTTKRGLNSLKGTNTLLAENNLLNRKYKLIDRS